MGKPITNHELDALLVEAGYDRSHAAFARQVNALAREQSGMKLRYDGASVYWWLRGRNPEPTTSPLIAVALSRRLGRMIGTDELGFSDGEIARLGLIYPSTLDSAVGTVTRLWRYLVMRREFLASVTPVALAATQAGWCWLFDPDDQTAARNGTRRVTAADVAVLMASRQQFLDLDRQYGGGHARAFLADFLHREISPLLHGSYTDQVGRKLFGATAQLTAQLAFMSYDSGAMGLAQRAYIQALRLSKAAGDQTFGAHILANMATQAIFLNKPAEAVQLSRAAIDAAKNAPANVMARLYSAEACAHGIAKDAHQTERALRAAERSMDQPTLKGPDWAGYFTPAHFAGAAVRSFRDLGSRRHALSYAGVAMTIAGGGARTQALHASLVATIHAEAGDLDRACLLGHQAVELAEQIRSRRVEERLRELMAILSKSNNGSQSERLVARGHALLASGVA